MSIHEVYMSVHKNNPASLRVQIKNGAYIHHENETEYFTRINAIGEGESREEIVGKFYTDYDEDSRYAMKSDASSGFHGKPAKNMP